MFKAFFKALGTVWRWINPTANTAQAVLIRAVATDLVRQYFLKHPNVKVIVETDVIPLIQFLMSMTGAKYDTAKRVVESVIHEITATNPNP